ncbi:MAG: peptide chain release factor N(5)-glutamine methyltransferase [Chloroflexi bacterium]|nr:MAG: peptide chain release factor N(5)-glutamine methyltransferase [Chloroflexota bacterium]MBL1195227.1 peptide chain release factor N(5)-glutamine methyltransferase [Chloroflexota bacterium]NOH12512.1 peptide chain release factor N(5)-glutamine methyltransferase [Chloroflexota bacterium]
MPLTITEALLHAREEKLPGDSPTLDAQVLLADVMRQQRAWLLAHPEAELINKQEADWADKLKRLASGEPLPYIIGHWEFFGLDFKVTPDVLIPRPETELLVETALGWLKEYPGKRRIVDVGTGSGCIAVSLAVNVISSGRTSVRPYTKAYFSPEIVAVDISEKALEVAQENAKAHKVDERIYFVQSDLLEAVEGPYDLICGNLPYIPSSKLPALEVYKHEPKLALDGGAEGLDLIERLLKDAGRVLNAGGLMLLEIEDGQRESALGLAEEVFSGAQSEVLADLAGKPRLLRIQT